MSCWEQQKLLKELREKFKAIPVWPPKPTMQFQVYDVLVRQNARDFEKHGTLRSLFPVGKPGDEAYQAAVAGQGDLKPEPFEVLNKTIRHVDWNAGLKALGQVAPQANIEVETRGSHKGDLEFSFDNIMTVRCSERLQISEALMKPKLLSLPKLAAINNKHVWVVVQTISIGKFECKVKTENKGLFKAKAKLNLPAPGAAAAVAAPAGAAVPGAAAPAAPNAEAGVDFDGWSTTDESVTYNKPEHPLVVGFVCLRYQVKDGNLVKPVFADKGDGAKKELNPEDWFEDADLDYKDAPPYFVVE